MGVVGVGNSGCVFVVVGVIVDGVVGGGSRGIRVVVGGVDFCILFLHFCPGFMPGFPIFTTTT